MSWETGPRTTTPGRGLFWVLWVLVRWVVALVQVRFGLLIRKQREQPPRWSTRHGTEVRSVPFHQSLEV